MVRERGLDTEVNTGLPAQRPGVIPRITAISGPGAGRAVAMTKATATIGRHATNDLVIDDARVSGVHLELRRVADLVHLRDAGSTNGTWLGTHRVRDVDLAVGAEITIGDSVLRVDTDAAAVPAAVSAEESFGELVSTSTAMREIFATLERVSPKNLGLLIQGDAGTGKEEMARAVVARSQRAAAPFVVIDVPSLPEAMVDAILFGHEAPGLLEAANGGTVLVDEVGVLSPTIQSKLLRLLERHELVRAGGHLPIKIDVRVIATTSRDLRHEIDVGQFREDLFFRLAQVRISVPALRDRIEDIPILCRKILSTVGEDVMIEASALDQLAAHPWPGNVRELRSVLERAAALTPDGVIRRADVAGEGFGFRGSRDERGALDLSGTFRDAKERAIERFEAAYLAALMRKSRGVVAAAAREADLARHHLRDLLKKRELYGVAWDKEEE